MRKLSGVFVLLFVAVFGSAAFADEIFDNGKLRFGNGAEPSVNTNGNLQQPFYYDGNLSSWFPLTYADYPLDNTIAIGGNGSSDWNVNGTLAENSLLANQVLDVSGFTVTGGSNGYGTIVSTGTLTIDGKTLQLKNTYTLGQDKSFIKIVTRLTNTSGATISNVRVWVGTRDDWVGMTDQPLKTRGNLVNGQFQAVSTQATRAAALRITSGETGVLFYSTSPKAYTAINSCCSFSNAYNQNPATSAIQLGGDGSYALFVRMDDLANGASEEFTWYYAAGEVSDLDDIVDEVAQEAQNWTVTASAGTGGTISPASATVADGATTEFTVTPSSSYNIASVQGCGGSLVGNTYTTGAITAACAVTASFSLKSYTVTANAGSGGTLGPASANVTHGSTTSFTVTPTTGYSIGSVTGCGGSLSGTTYTTGTITGACTVTASFSLNSYTVTANAGSGGFMGPASASVNHGSTTSFTVTPSVGYSIVSATGCGGTLIGNTFTTGAITGACAVTASFALNVYTVTASAGTGGSIGPANATVTHGNASSFTVTPATGYSVNSVSGCGGALSGSTFTTGAVTAGCAITATFSLNSYTVTATAGQGGSVSPGSATVNHGSTTSFVLTPDTGYSVVSAQGCSGHVTGNTYTTGAVTGACAIAIEFAQTLPVFTPASPPVYELDATSLTLQLPNDVAPHASDYQGNALEVTLVGGVTRYAPGEHILTWRTVDSRGVAATVQQTLHVWPTVSMGKDLALGHRQGNSGAFRIVLNGLSPVYPFTVNYTVSGYMTGHDLTSGSAQFTAGETEKEVYLAVMETAAAGSPNREIDVALDAGVNLGDRDSLKITLLSGNAAPVAQLSARQGGERRYAFGRSDGPIAIVADVQDPNSNDTHTVQWTSPNGATVTAAGAQLTVQADSLPAGVHRFEALVTDNGTPSLSSRASFELVLRDTAPALPNGVTAWAENGLPDDPDFNPPIRNVLPERAGELHHFLIESDPGVRLRLGSHALLEGLPQAELPSTTSGVTADTIANVGGYFDFTVSDLSEVGQSVNVIVPQRARIPANAVYRKFDTAQRRWNNFVEDDANRLASAPGEEGFCPPPGSMAYRAGLNVGDWCVRLTLTDGGPNDDDGQANGSVVDPGGVAAMAAVVVTTTASGSGGGGGSTDFLLLLLGAVLLMWRRTRVSLAALGVLAIPAIAAAQDEPVAASSTGWYAAFTAGEARGEVSEDDINSRLVAAGYDVTATFDDQDRSAWRLFAGYQLMPYLSLQLGYTELGEIGTTLTGNVVDIEEFLSSANRLQPRSANGFELAAVGRYPLTSRLVVLARGGVFRWDSNSRARDAVAAFDNFKDSGSDGFFGAGLEVALHGRWNLSADWTHYRVDEETIGLLGLGVVYRLD